MAEFKKAPFDVAAFLANAELGRRIVAGDFVGEESFAGAVELTRRI